MANLLASLLIPSRKRNRSLIECIESFLGSAVDINTFEVLVRLDDDAPPLERVPDRTRVITGPRPLRGYADIHLLYNELYKASSGQYVWVLNDDVRLMSDSWDMQLASYENQMFIGHPRHDVYPGGNLFPIIHRSIINAQGFLGLYGAVDVQYEKLVERLPMLNKPLDHLVLRHLIDMHRETDLPPASSYGNSETDARFFKGLQDVIKLLHRRS